jgi:hypothetical protein
MLAINCGLYYIFQNILHHDAAIIVTHFVPNVEHVKMCLNQTSNTTVTSKIISSQLFGHNLQMAKGQSDDHLAHMT